MSASSSRSIALVSSSKYLVKEAQLTAVRLLAAATKLVALQYSQFKGQLLVADGQLLVLGLECLFDA
mgnify:CR=1 FL=1